MEIFNVLTHQSGHSGARDSMVIQTYLDVLRRTTYPIDYYIFHADEEDKKDKYAYTLTTLIEHLLAQEMWYVFNNDSAVSLALWRYRVTMQKPYGVLWLSAAPFDTQKMGYTALPHILHNEKDNMYTQHHLFFSNMVCIGNSNASHTTQRIMDTHKMRYIAVGDTSLGIQQALHDGMQHIHAHKNAWGLCIDIDSWPMDVLSQHLDMLCSVIDADMARFCRGIEIFAIDANAEHIAQKVDYLTSLMDHLHNERKSYSQYARS